jgi:hypothetical protein
MAKIRSLVFCLAAILFSSALASDIIPMAYQGYDPYGLSHQKEEMPSLANNDAIHRALDELLKPIPEYPSWIAKGSIPGNANEDGADQLRSLAEHHAHFTREEIDAMLPALNHVDFSVRNDINIVLERTLGIGVILSGEGWVAKEDKSVRQPYVELWRKFWADNRDGYGAAKPYIINGLSLDAACVKPPILQITITNHGSSPVHLWSEVPGKVSDDSFHKEITALSSMMEIGNPFSIILGGKLLKPAWPRSITRAMSQCYLTDEEFQRLPDRAVHYEEITIAPGQAFQHEMNLTEAFPKTNLSGQKIVLSYDTLYGELKDSLWRGELRSAPIQLP